MEEQVVIVNKNGEPDKKAMRKQKIKNFMQNTMDKGGAIAKSAWKFCVENKENLTFMIGLAATGATALGKLKSSSKRDEHREYVDTSVYDYVTHTRFYLKRPLTNSENIEYLRRIDRGEPAYEVLRDMRVLRR